ncbi:YXWGXW repeat-containing protein [Mucilaginibacter ximonensis]|uniref:YXWGXW repeat-containing protein n=1 Tax=Mucilaginibacter ximonensis TaxID=538021 RepID=A0ABW5YBR3_9SPHI
MKSIFKIFLLLGVTLLVSPAAEAQVSVGIHVNIAPPALPVYEQPECPVDGWLWQPGYWAYDPVDGYYWVPGVWVAPPEPGVVWTPCYWGFDDGVYVFHRGYWGPHVGFYGGINYGYGYPGYGFYGGMWSGRVFRYNTAVFRVNRTVVRNVYVNRVTVRPTASRASFNGRGGVMAQPRPEDRRAMNERHFQPTHTQIAHQQNAGHNPAQRFSANHGRPSMPVMSRPGNHAISSPMSRQGVNHGNPAQNHNNPGFNRNPAQNHNPAENHKPGSFNRGTPQINRSNPSHMDMNRAQHMAPQRQQPQRMEQHNMPQQRHQFQPQRMEPRSMPQQHMEQPRQVPQQQHMMQPQRMPQPQHMGGGGFGGGMPHPGGNPGGGGGGHFGGGGGHGGGHRP